MRRSGWAVQPQPNKAALCIPAQAKLAGKLRRHILPSRGIRVSAAELAKGNEATATAVVALLRGRPELQFLQLSLEANGIQAVQVSWACAAQSGGCMWACHLEAF